MVRNKFFQSKAQKTRSHKAAVDRPADAAKQGFTIIEVMLFLAITGLMLIGVLGGTYASIARQRYNDSLRSFTEFLRTIFNEVQSPESLGEGNSDQYAIYGKIAVFGLGEADSDDAETTVYTTTLVGDVMPPSSSDGFVNELAKVNARLYCGQAAGINQEQHESPLADYTMQWDAKLQNIQKTNFTGTVIIARSPTTGTIHAAYTEETYNIAENCQPGNSSASQRFHDDLLDNPKMYTQDDTLTFCVKSNNSRIVRGVELDLTGHNTSSISMLPDGEDNPCR